MGRPTSDFNPELEQDGVSCHFWLGHSCLLASPLIVFKEKTVRSQSCLPGCPTGPPPQEEELGQHAVQPVLVLLSDHTYGFSA